MRSTDAPDAITPGMRALRETPFAIEAFDRALGADAATPPTWLSLELCRRAADEGHPERVASIARDARRPPRLRATAAQALLRRGVAWMRDVLHESLRAGDVWARIIACDALREAPDALSIPALAVALDDHAVVCDLWAAERVSNHAALALAALAEGRALPALARWLRARRAELGVADDTTRHLAIMVLAELGDAEGIEAARLARDRDDPFGEYDGVLKKAEARGGRGDCGAGGGSG